MQPQSDVVRLYAEDSLLTGSKTLNVVNDETISADEARSAGMGWNAADWSSDED